MSPKCSYFLYNERPDAPRLSHVWRHGHSACRLRCQRVRWTRAISLAMPASALNKSYKSTQNVYSKSLDDGRTWSSLSSDYRYVFDTATVVVLFWWGAKGRYHVTLCLSWRKAICFLLASYPVVMKLSSTVIPQLTKIIRSGITFVSRNLL